MRTSSPEHPADTCHHTVVQDDCVPCLRAHLVHMEAYIARLRAALYQLAEDAEVAHQGGLHRGGSGDG